MKIKTICDKLKLKREQKTEKSATCLFFSKMYLRVRSNSYSWEVRMIDYIKIHSLRLLLFGHD